ncbi:MAG: hypothetical protein R8J94_05895 [Acidimicrobiia bacterium]|nr:hypothetical protein [Acidimicrobiia bacterium]
MAGTPVPEDSPKLGWKATVAGLIFALAVLGGFSAATAVSYEGDKGHGDDHGEEHSDDDHGEEEHSE